MSTRSYLAPACIYLNYFKGIKPVARYIYKCILFFAILFLYTNATAQHNTMRMNYSGNGFQSDYALSFGALADVPLHNFDGSFKTSPGFEAGVLRYFGNFVVGLHGGYRSFKSKYNNAQLYDDETGAGVGTAYLSNYTSISLYASAVYQLDLGRMANLQAGLNLGNYFSHIKAGYALGFETDDGTYSSSADFGSTEAQFYVAPRIGINFKVSEDVQLGLQARYNVFGNYRYEYNNFEGGQSSGTVFNSFAAGINLIYRFP